MNIPPYLRILAEAYLLTPEYTAEESLTMDVLEAACRLYRGLDTETVVSDAEKKPLSSPRRLAEYHEDLGAVLWWRFPVDEPPYVGTPGDSDWPGYHTHWTAILCPEEAR